MNSPQVSIIIPVYNAEKYIRQTVQSALDQTFRDFEIIILNDGSKDGSPEILRQLQKEDDRIQVIDKPNTGVSDTRNIGISLARGKYLAFLDSDDIWKPRNLERKVSTLETNGKRWVFSDYDLIDEKGNLLVKPERKLSEDDILNRLLLWDKGDVVPGPCSNIIAEKKIFEEGVQFDVALSSPADRDMSIQLAARSVPAVLQESLWQYRIHPQSMSNQNLKVASEVKVFIRKMRKSDWFTSKSIRRRSLSNLYYMLAGYNYTNGYRFRGLKYIVRAFWLSPANIWDKKMRHSSETTKTNQS